MKNLAIKLQEILFTPWVLAAALLTGFGALLLIQRQHQATEEFVMAEKFPLTFMTQVETREFDEQGKLQQVISTPRITQYQVDPDKPGNQDYTLIEQPRIRLHQNEKPNPWFLSAKLGHRQANQDELRLINDVHLEQQTQDQGLVTIDTSELWIYPGKQVATTDKAVTMHGTAIQVNAVGMDAQLLQDTIQLKSQVRATYEPKP